MNLKSGWRSVEQNAASWLATAQYISSSGVCVCCGFKVTLSAASYHLIKLADLFAQCPVCKEVPKGQYVLAAASGILPLTSEHEHYLSHEAQRTGLLNSQGSGMPRLSCRG
ncbi:unnamed protein product [Polarella glacialis]|uniref:Uncharacterized protein n=1 Tax=Polarella glacialis TaxID=89957 RepID=A0A813DE34_POLGL|nr:unnamed protein product [Polarella glacialis]CAE8607781.1 unnamed protein product [Polarella glacialis]